MVCMTVVTVKQCQLGHGVTAALTGRSQLPGPKAADTVPATLTLAGL